MGRVMTVRSPPPAAPQAPNSGLSGLEAAARALSGDRGLPPIDTWNPPDCGDLDIRIAVDGSWSYMGSPIGRLRLVRLFSSILRREGPRYVLVTPVEKVGIIVDDVPFLAVELEVTGRGRGQRLVFRTNVDDITVAGPEHPLRVDTAPTTLEPRPYIHVRGELEALIARSVFYELVDLAERVETPEGAVLGVWSEGAFFRLGLAPDEQI